MVILETLLHFSLVLLSYFIETRNLDRNYTLQVGAAYELKGLLE